MGNTLNNPPTSYSSSNPSQMQQDAWTNTYTADPNAKTDRIPWGNKGSHLSIGAKVLQQVPGVDLYVQNAQGKKFFITKGGKQLPNAFDIIKNNDPNFGYGPLVEILGPPTSPEMYMWTGTEMTHGDAYKPVKINSMADLQNAITSNTNPSIASPAIDHKHSGQYGDASISGPFQKMPKDLWSAVGEENRAIGTIGSQLVVPIAADVVGNFIPGFGAVTSATGLQQDLTDALTNTVNSLKKNMQYKGTSDYNLSMSNIITDPRLTNYYNESHAGYTNMAHQTQNHDPNVLGMPNDTPEQKILKARALEESAGSMQADINAKQLESLMAQTKLKYPKLSWNYFNQMSSGLALATTAQQKMNILNHFSDKLIGQVKNAQALEQMEQSGAVPSSPQKTGNSPLKGSGFQPISWNSLVINGSYHHEPGKVVIQG